MKKKMLVQGDSPFLPDEIITNILKRLPVKTLIRFQRVSKYWKSLVRSFPYFIADHLHHHTSNQIPCFLYNRGGYDPLNLFEVDNTRTYKSVYLWKPSFMRKLSHTRIINICNGLICIRSDSVASFLGTSLFIWNPATREVRCVPGVIDRDVDGVYCFGFGFSPILNDYKIVKTYMSDVNQRVEVYSLNTDTWTEIELGNTEIGRISHGHVSFNGSIFWVLEKMNGIVSFDLARQVFTFIPVPGSYIRSLYSKVFELNKKLVLVGYFTTSGRYDAIHLWEMEEVVDVSSDKKWSWKKTDKIRPCISHLFTQVLPYVESLVPIAKINCEEPKS